MRWLAEVRVMLRPSVNDPPGQSIRAGLHSLGFRQVEAVRSGKLIQVLLSAADRAGAEDAVARMGDQLLANPVIEQFTFTLAEQPEDASAGAARTPAP